MTDMSEAIAARITAAKEAADERRRQSFEPDPELERLGERMDQMRETSPQEYAGANFGDLATRVTTYRRRKAEHEENNR